VYELRGRGLSWEETAAVAKCSMVEAQTDYLAVLRILESPSNQGDT